MLPPSAAVLWGCEQSPAMGRTPKNSSRAHPLDHLAACSTSAVFEHPIPPGGFGSAPFPGCCKGKHNSDHQATHCCIIHAPVVESDGDGGKGGGKTLQNSLRLQRPRGIWGIVILMGADGSLLLQGWMEGLQVPGTGEEPWERVLAVTQRCGLAVTSLLSLVW